MRGGRRYAGDGLTDEHSGRGGLRQTAFVTSASLAVSARGHHEAHVSVLEADTRAASGCVYFIRSETTDGEFSQISWTSIA